jgi:hypothetical protein
MNGAENFSDISENDHYADSSQLRPRNEGTALKNALPVISFKKSDYKNTSVENKDKLECSICFCEFEDND